MTVPLEWRPSPLARSLATASAVALILAVLGHRPELVAFAAPLLGALVTAWRPAPTHVTVQVGRPTERCFEHEIVTVNVSAPGAQTALCPIAGLTVLNQTTLRADRWGRFSLPVKVTMTASGGLLHAEAIVEPVEIRVYPRPEPLFMAPRPERLPDRVGVHIERIRGEGVEFHGIRQYVPGDQLSRINWPVSVRFGRWHVTERLAERAADLVALIDTYPVSEPAKASLDLAVHGAAEIVQAALKRGDRAGVLALGGTTRWLPPEVGRRQFYRIADAVLDATPDTRPTGGRVPRSALPPGACVIAFSPLLDARIGLALQDIRHRGHPVLVVDVLREPPVETGEDPLIHRMWRLERRSLHRDLATLGIPVVTWPVESTLDTVLYPLARRPLR